MPLSEEKLDLCDALDGLPTITGYSLFWMSASSINDMSAVCVSPALRDGRRNDFALYLFCPSRLDSPDFRLTVTVDLHVGASSA